MKIAIIGGAGYIGGVTTHLACSDGHDVTVIDNLSTGHEYNIPRSATFIQADVCNRESVRQVFENNHFDAVMHFAAKILVPESMHKPYEYYDVNTVGALNVIDAAAKAHVDCYILSSTAAVYGAVEQVPITEDMPTKPVNPYGMSKLLTEQLLQSYQITHNLQWAAMRYFNVAGAYDGVGTDYPFISHIIPMLLDKMDKNEPITINGRDYDTQDGTAVRDYVHVVDIARAHLLAVKHIQAENAINQPINLGSQHGFSVQQVADAFNAVTGANLPFVYGTRRAGDPARLIASNERAKQLLGWRPEHDLKKIIQDHYDWYRAKRTHS